MDTWLAVLVVIGSVIGMYSEFCWRKLFASVIENAKQKAAEIDRLRGITWTHEDTIRDHKEQIADRGDTIENLIAERDEHARRILSLEDSYRAKCKEVDGMDWEITACREARAAAFKLNESLTEYVQVVHESRARNLFSPVTFQPKRAEWQPQKPACDN